MIGTDQQPEDQREEDNGAAPTRRRVIGAGVAGACAGVAGIASACADHPEDDSPGTVSLSGHAVHRERAARAVAALQKNFAVDDGSDLLREFHPTRSDGEPYSYEWPFSQARIAVLELAHAGGHCEEAVGDLEALIDSRDRGQERYWHTPGGTTGLPGYASATDLEQGAHGTYFYDDNSWVALAEIEEHLITCGQRGNLERVHEVIALLRSAEATDPNQVRPGGLYWSQGDDGDRNTVATMPAAKILLRMHQITGDESFLEDAIRWVDWTREHLLAPEGLFWDHVKRDGSIEKTFWSYNQGVPLGVEALLYRITGDAEHRKRAFELYRAIVEHYEVFDRGGRLDADQPVFFNAILCSNLLMAQALIGEEFEGVRITRAVAERAWADQRDPATDLLTKRNDQGELEVLAQAGFARLLALAAMPRRHWADLC